VVFCPPGNVIMKASQISRNGRSRDRRSGSTILEFAICVPCIVFLFFGTIGVGLMMGRYIQTVQVGRDVAHMYSDGVDFTQTTPQNIIVQQLAAGTGLTATGGSGVIIFSQVQTVYQVDCTAAAVTPCTNIGVPVFTQRVTVGNTSLRTSRFGTPSASILDAKGNISPSVYLSNSNSSVLTTGFEAALDAAQVSAGLSGTAPAQPQGNIAYIAEVFFQYPDVGFLGFSTSGGAYSVFIFN